MKKVKLSKQDIKIIEQVLLYVCNDDKTEIECAKAVELGTQGEVSKDNFHDWIAKFSLIEM